VVAGLARLGLALLGTAHRPGPPLLLPVPSRLPAGYPWHWSRST
jgi:hypothetical protein